MEKGNSAVRGNFDFDFSIDLFASGDGWFFPGGLDRLFDQSTVPGEVVRDAVGSASVAGSVSATASALGRDFGGETILDIGDAGAGGLARLFGVCFAFLIGRRNGDFFLGGADFDLMFGFGRSRDRSRRGNRFRFLGGRRFR